MNISIASLRLVLVKGTSVHSEYDIIIAGAGPAGCTAALTLKDTRLKIAIIEKAVFPRDKVCGDAIPSRAIRSLRLIDPILASAFDNYDRQLLTRNTDVVYNGSTLQLNWQIPAYTCTRMDFDNKLFDLVQQYSNCDIYQGEKVDKIEQSADDILITTDNNKVFRTKLLIGADGAQGITAKQLTSLTLDREHHIGAVRAYYKNIKEIQQDKTEMFLDKRFNPGYFWMFPVADGHVNVGFGMLSADIATKKVNLRRSLYEFIETVPSLKERFADAEQVSKIEGHNLPLGSRRVTMSGERFMLCGDAASLIDPITGEGIGNAMLSGRLAGLQALKCFTENIFSGEYISKYDDQVWSELGKELKLRSRAQKVLRRMPFLLDVVFKFSGWEPVRKMIQQKF